MQTIIQFLSHIWNFVSSGLGIFHPSDNYHIYPIFLVLILWITIFSFFRRIKECVQLCSVTADSIPQWLWLFLQSFWRFLLAGLLSYVPALLFWWSLSSSPDQLPGWNTPSDDLVLGVVGASGLYHAVAYVIHFLVLFLTIQLLYAFYVQPYFSRLMEQYIRARRPDDIQVFNFSIAMGRISQSIYQLFFVVCIILSDWSRIALAFSWIVVGAYLSSNMIISIFGMSAYEMVSRPFRRVRFVGLLSTVLYAIVFVFLWFIYNLDRSNQFVDLFALFTLWVTVDGVLISLMGFVDPSPSTFFRKSTPVRLVIALPLITLVTILGSNGAFPSLNIHASLWLIAGAGGAVYALFTPLIDTVRRVDTAQHGAQIETSIFRHTMQRTVAGLLKLGIRIGERYTRFLLAPFEEDDSSVQVGKVIDSSGNEVTDLQEFEETQNLVQEAEEAIDVAVGAFTDVYAAGKASTSAALPPNDASSAGSSSPDAALKRFQSLAFPTYWIFLVALIVYQMYSSGVYTPISTDSLHLGSVSLSWSSVTGIFSLVNLLFGLGFPKPVKFFSGFLVLFTVSILVMLNAVTSKAGLLGIHNDNLAEFLDLTTTLLLLGHVLYLLKVLFLLLRGDLRGDS